MIHSPHTFHIPVMGLGYTIDTPVKVARFGIDSVISIIEDNLVEQMRELYCSKENEEYVHIGSEEPDHRARRITAYLNLLGRIVEKQVKEMKAGDFSEGSETSQYFELLPASAPAKVLYEQMKAAPAGPAKQAMQDELRNMIVAGAIDVNIMTKCDRPATAAGEAGIRENSDACAALRGFANSTLASSVVFSAGMNPHLYSYCASFDAFKPGKDSTLQKKIILKVSDYRSALVQGKFLAKKGLWVSEFRIESGLNCGGHAFATEGLLLGPILDEFRSKREELYRELLDICNTALVQQGCNSFEAAPEMRISVQGGIGTANENTFLLEYYGVDSTGWGSPFLLVPEATNVDDETLKQLATAVKDDYYMSYASPLGVAFNNFRKSTSEEQRKERIAKNRPGSPCNKKFLSFNTEFTEETICTASRQYQDLKLKELEKTLSGEALKEASEKVMEKDCLCEGLGAAVLIRNNIIKPKQLKAVAICPGPNLAYFSGIFSLRQMIDHIYGRTNLLNSLYRPNMFVNELLLYIDYLKQEARKAVDDTLRHSKFIEGFKANLRKGIEYYRTLLPVMKLETREYRELMLNALNETEAVLDRINPEPVMLMP